MFVLIAFGSVYYYGSSKAFSEKFKGVIQNQLSKLTGTQVELNSITFSPLPLTIELKGIKIIEKSSKMVIAKIENLKIYLKLLALINKKFHASMIEIIGLRLNSEGVPYIIGLLSGFGKSQKQILRIDKVLFRTSRIEYKTQEFLINALISEIDYHLKRSRLKFSGKVIALKYKDFFIKRFSSKGTLLFFPNKIEIKKISVKKEDASVSMEGDFFVDLLKINLNVLAELKASEIFKTINKKIPIKGDLRIKGVVNGLLSSPLFEGLLYMQNGQIYGFSVKKLETPFKITSSQLCFSKIKAKAYGGFINGFFLMRLPYQGFSLVINATDVMSEPLVARLHLNNLQIAKGKVKLFLMHTGYKFNPRGFIEYVADIKEGDSWRDVKRLKGYFWQRNNLLYINEFTMKWNGGRFYNSKGWIATDRNKLYLKGSTHIKSFTSLGIAMKGVFKGNLTLEGAIKSPRIFLDGFLEGVNIKGLSLGKLKVRGCVSGRCIVLKPAKQQAMIVQGIFRKDLIHLIATANQILLGKLLPDFKDIKGKLSGNISIDGTPDNMQGKALVIVDDLFYKDRFLGNIQTTLFLDRHGLDIKNFILKNKGSLLKGSVSIKEGIINTERIEYSLNPQDYGLLRNSSIRIEGSLYISGSLTKPYIKGNAKIFASTLKIGHINLDFMANKLSFNASIFKDNIEASGIINVSNKYSWQMEIDFKKTNYAKLLRSFSVEFPPELSIWLKGHVSALGGTNKTLVQGKFDEVSIEYKHKFISNKNPLVLKYDGQWIDIEPFQLGNDSVEATLMGKFDTTFSNVSLSLFGDLKMPFLNGLISELNFRYGLASFSFALNGAFSSNNLYGGINIQDIDMLISSVGEDIKIKKGQIYLQQGRFSIRNFTGTAMNGHFKVHGEGLFNKNFIPSEYNIKAELKSFVFRPFPSMEFRFNSELFLTDTIEGPYLSGRVYVIDGVITKDITFKELFSLKKKDSLPSTGPFSNIKLNVLIDIPETVRVDNNILEATVKSSFSLTGSVGSMGMLGTIEFKEGYLYFRNNRFDIVHAVVEFTNPDFIRPYIDFVGSTEIRQYTIRVNVNGYPEDLKITLYSEPYLDRADILSLLTFGTLAEGTRGLEGELGASEAALFLTGQLQESLQDKLRTLTGIDRIDIEPYIEESGGIGPRITFYKRLLSDRVSIVYTTTTSEQMKDTLEIILKITNSVSISGQRDERGFLGGDIRFRLRFR